MRHGQHNKERKQGHSQQCTELESVTAPRLRPLDINRQRASSYLITLLLLNFLFVVVVDVVVLLLAVAFSFCLFLALFNNLVSSLGYSPRWLSG